ncbi:hypothetical protein [Bifidobacterium bombi]|uniref:hypothetical protein n=1 Tax=Bifidobacterium bombi TaxID=471511 RepID=UPI0012E0216B|nr:hypothetical protein [Bifidobacterium bombi]
MEIGTLAEWATAIAETLAVLVALFLPYKERRKSERKATRNFKLTLYAAVVRCLEEKNMDTVRTIVSISRLTEAGTRNKADLDTAQQILNLYDNSTLDPASLEREIKTLAQQIKPQN